ncbi:MAG: hypothetical protein M9899_00455 [Bdellovibrionaceae bacterium]|nr:hypothetical protein [Pseudobdellovibrionaceae bacterium]
MKERLTPPPKEISDFMFEQRLFDFANKDMSSFTYRDMKHHMDNNIDAREKVGAVLLAFEYFNAISEIQIEYDDSIFTKKNKQRWYKLKSKFKTIVGTIFFMALFFVLYLCYEDLTEYFTPRLQELKSWLSEFF